MSTSQYRASAVPPRQPTYATPAFAPPAPAAPAGTFQPGTKVQVGKHRVVIEKYLSEGGFAHVYLVRLAKPADGSGTSRNASDVAVLKRVAVPDKEALALMRTEVDTMKRLRGHRHIVVYMDSHASQLKGGGYEVFLLMEYCQGGGLIDFMNTRLQHRLTEPEILNIFADVAEGVAAMHYLVPPLLHRDLKVENVLISHTGSSSGGPVYKLCDFGSAAQPRPAATTAAEGRLIEDDVQRHTTLQYRAPEMIDVYRKQPIDEKSDVWALGVLLYKLCYYTTPFEEQGQMAILNASFKYPAYPVFSDRLKKLVGAMLKESPAMRPNIYQIVKEVCGMRGTAVPIKDIYANRSQSQTRRYQELPPPSPTASSPPAIGLTRAVPTQEVEDLPDITPMRRGRPTAPSQSQQQHTVTGRTRSPMRGTAGDPFAALDSTDPSVRAAAADELAAKFLSLDEFSLLHDSGAKFEFGTGSGATAAAAEPAKQDAFQKRVTQALADDAFAAPVAKSTSAPLSKPSSRAAELPAKVASAAARMQSTRQDDKALPSLPLGAQSVNVAPTKATMVSTGVGSSPPASPAPYLTRDFKNRPIYRFPQTHAAASSNASARDAAASSSSSRRSNSLKSPHMPDLHRSKSSTMTKSPPPALDMPTSPASSRPSLEAQRPLMAHLTDGRGDALARERSANAKRAAARVSMYVDRNGGFARDGEGRRGAAGDGGGAGQGTSARFEKGAGVEGEGLDSSDEEGPLDLDYDVRDRDREMIADNVEFLRAMEDGGGSGQGQREKEKGGPMKMFMQHAGGKKDRRGSRHGSKAAGGGGGGGGGGPCGKRSSIGAALGLGLGGGLRDTKEILKGRFGDAFKKFEGGFAGERGDGLSLLDETRQSTALEKSPSDGGPAPDFVDEYGDRDAHNKRNLQALGLDSDADFDFVEEQDLSAEVRRELERQRLDREERRVEQAKEEYRYRYASRLRQATDGVSASEAKASSIQKRVLSLLDEAEGRSRSRSRRGSRSRSKSRSGSGSKSRSRSREPARKTAEGYGAGAGAYTHFAKTHQAQLGVVQSPPGNRSCSPPLVSNTPTMAASSLATTAVAAPAVILPPQRTATSPRPYAPPKPQTLRTGLQRTGGGGPSLDALLQRDLVGVADMPVHDKSTTRNSAGAEDAAAWEANFQRKYPSLSGIEMVEKEIPLRIRDV